MGKKGRKGTHLPQKHHRTYKHQAGYKKKRRHRRLYWIQDCPDLLPPPSDENDVNNHDLILIKLTEIHLADDLHGTASTIVTTENSNNDDVSNQPPQTSTTSIIDESNHTGDDNDTKTLTALPKEQQADEPLQYNGESQQKQISINEVPAIEIHHIDSKVADQLVPSTTDSNMLSSVTTRTPKVYVQRIQAQNQSHLDIPPSNYCELPNGNNGDGVCNPYNPNSVPHKYWAQRKRLFHLYDNGIQMGMTEKDIGEAFFSITPQCIAQHIANRMIQHHYRNIRANHCTNSNNKKEPLIIVDAFVGVGGNAIALALQDPNVVVVCIDIDMNKLHCTAHNACHVYHIPQHQLLLLHHDACTILSQYYESGKRRRPDDCTPSNTSTATWNVTTKSEPTTDTEKLCGYALISSYDDLPNYIHGIFLSPPWGGVKYEDIGPRHYNIQSNIELRSSATIPHSTMAVITTPSTTGPGSLNVTEGESNNVEFLTTTSNEAIVNGELLLHLAVHALPIDRLNICYYLPRNLNGIMFGQSCYNILVRDCDGKYNDMHAPQQLRQHRQHESFHHIELEQNIVNTKLKTVTAYIQSCPT